MWVSRHHSGGVAPFGFSGINACMQLPRNVSPVSASFFGPKRQGIHPVLCVACSFFLLFPLLMEWFSVSSLAEVFSKIEAISLCSCSGTSGGKYIPNPWRVGTLQLIVPVVLSFCLFLTDLEVDEE